LELASDQRVEARVQLVVGSARHHLGEIEVVQIRNAPQVHVTKDLLLLLVP